MIDGRPRGCIREKGAEISIFTLLPLNDTDAKALCTMNILESVWRDIKEDIKRRTNETTLHVKISAYID